MVARSLAAQAGRQPRSEVTSVTVPSARTSQRRNAAVVSQKHDFSKTDTVTYQEYGPNVVTTLYVNQPLNLPPLIAELPSMPSERSFYVAKGPRRVGDRDGFGPTPRPGARCRKSTRTVPVATSTRPTESPGRAGINAGRGRVGPVVQATMGDRIRPCGRWHRSTTAGASGATWP